MEDHGDHSDPVIVTASHTDLSVEVTEETGKTKIMRRLFKLCNTLFISSVFLFFIITEYDPARAMESLTYQVLGINKTRNMKADVNINEN